MLTSKTAQEIIMFVISTLDMHAQHLRGIVLAVIVLTNQTNSQWIVYS